IELYSSVLAGACVYIVPETVRKEPVELNRYYEENGITISFMTTLMGCLFSTLNKTLRVLITGGEKMNHVTAPKYRMVHAYGPTECSLFATTCDIKGEFDGKFIGRPLSNYRLYVVDPYKKPVPEGAVGELLIGGAGVGKGYLNRQKLTDEKFIELKLRGEADGPDRVYCTGDLVRFGESGDLIFVGRMDDQVKLRGLRIELGEIESRASSHDHVTGAAAAVKNDTLVMYYTSDEAVSEEELKSYLLKTLPSYMVPDIFMHLDSIPVNANGKTDRKLLPEPSFKDMDEYVVPETDTEKAVAECMQRVLGLEKSVGALSNFFEFGGDSIKAIRIITELRSRNITVSVADIMREKTVRAIAAVCHVNEPAEISQEPFEGMIEDTPVVTFFKRLKLPVASHFNQSILLRCRQRADKVLLQKVVDALCLQHDLLRAVWADEHLMVQGPDKSIEVEEYTGDKGTVTDICNEIQSGIHMNEALIRIALIHGDPDDYVLIIAHHLIVDGVSWRIISEDLETAYGQVRRGGEVQLPWKTNTYADYARSIRTFRDSYRLSLEREYWDETQKKLLALPVTDALDYTRPMKQKFMVLKGDEAAGILHMDLSGRNLEINDVLLAAVCISYGALTGEESVSIQMEGHGREDIGEQLLTDRTVGWFTSVYPVVVEGIKNAADIMGDDEKTDIISKNLSRVKDSLHRVPGKGVGYNVLRTVPGADACDYSFDRIAQIGFNYLGEMSVEKVTDEDGDTPFFMGTEISAGDNMAKENIFGPDLSINCSASKGQVVWMLDYNSAKYPDEAADEFLHLIKKTLGDIRSLLADGMPQDEITASDLGETKWSYEEFSAVIKDFGSRGEKIRRIYPLTPMQEGMLLKHLEDPKDFAYRIVNYFDIDMVPTKEELVYAMDKMMENNEVLRTAIIHEGVSVPRQALVERPPFVEMIDLRGEEDPEKAVEKIREDILSNGFDLQKKPLAQLYCGVYSDEGCYIIVAVHHAIIDGWSFQLFIDQLFDYLDEAVDRLS
ncbi:MAG: AMP-binding protein, partial [Lachnospiraceae bacterium]|nr:AMP-binding protein [Lachnospiraceae bacterium]